MSTELRVPDASCGHCKETIETSVAAIRGVRTAEMDLDRHTLSIEHDDSVELDTLVGAVSAAGYSPETSD